MNKNKNIPRAQTIGEEIANSILHGIGALFAIIGFIPLVSHVNGGINGKTVGIVSVIIYAAAIFVMFMSSTIYHASVKKSIKKVMRIFDHAAIYLLIAGTYTPICLIVLPRNVGLIILIFQYVCATCGIVFHALNFKFLKKVEVLIYCIMGLTIFTAAPYFGNIPFFALVMLLSGGFAYITGIIFYKQPQKKLMHVIWHIFVLAGAISHWISVFSIVCS